MPTGLARLPQIREGARSEPELAARPRLMPALSLAACGFLAAVLAFSGLGARPLISPAEARYALVAREMLEGGDWIQPRLNHVRFYEKPPLTYWSVAASYRLFGFDEFASRLPSALSYVGTVLVTFLIASELAGSGAALPAALIYATSLGPFLFGRFLFTDTLLVFCLSLSLLGLARTARRPQSRSGPLLLYLGASLAGLAKGLIGLLFPLATAAVYALLIGGRRYLRALRLWLGAAIVTAVFLPWHVLLAVRDPAFLSFYFGNEHLARFFNRRDPVNYTPLSVPAFWLSTLLWLFPWALFLPSALPRLRRPRSRRLALVWIWSAGIVLFFTLTASRMEYYALPAFPAVAVLLASGWQRFLKSGRRTPTILVPSLIATGIGLASAALLFLPTGDGSRALAGLVSNLDGYYREYFASHPEASMVFSTKLLRMARPFPIVLLLLGAASFLALRKDRGRLAFGIWVACLLPILFLADAGMRLVGADRSQKDAAAIVNAGWTPGARLVVAGDYEEACGISFYTGRPTSVLGGPGADLAFGYRRGDAPEVFLTRDAFRKAWESSDRVFVLGGRDLALPHAALLFEGSRSRLLLSAGGPESAFRLAEIRAPGSGHW